MTHPLYSKSYVRRKGEGDSASGSESMCAITPIALKNSSRGKRYETKKYWKFSFIQWNNGRVVGSDLNVRWRKI
jgi:hypothetical protein